MTHIAAIIFSLAASQAETPVLRTHANRYVVTAPFGDTAQLTTKNCTVTADGTLRARVRGVNGRAWLIFLDNAGEEEGQCEISVRPIAQHGGAK